DQAARRGFAPARLESRLLVQPGLSRREPAPARRAGQRRLAAARTGLRGAALYGLHVGDPRGRWHLRLLHLPRWTGARNRGADPAVALRFLSPGVGMPSPRPSAARA